MSSSPSSPAYGAQPERWSSPTTAEGRQTRGPAAPQQPLRHVLDRIAGLQVLTFPTSWQRIWFVLFIILAAVHFYPAARDRALGVELTAAERGARTAAGAGCFDCHGPLGSGGVKNPGSADGEVPGFSGGTPMMWAKSEDEIREYILDGAPARKRNDLRHQQQMQAQLLTMPAYRGYLGADEVDALIVYIRAVSGLIVPPDALAAQGQDLAVRLACFQCHGPMGSGGSKNLGSFKGYIPGWWGSDFRELVRNDDELRDWLRDGQIARLRDHPIAKHFLHGQRISMPGYKNFITDQQLRALIRYVRWVNDGAWQGQALDLGH
jgi:mono/diheme cytochrome c family protein